MMFYLCKAPSCVLLLLLSLFWLKSEPVTLHLSEILFFSLPSFLFSYKHHCTKAKETNDASHLHFEFFLNASQFKMLPRAVLQSHSFFFSFFLLKNEYLEEQASHINIKV